MDGSISKAIWSTIAFVWMCVEIGQFIANKTGLDQNTLFWPLWICINFLILFGGYIIDIRRVKSSSTQSARRRNSPRSE